MSRAPTLTQCAEGLAVGRALAAHASASNAAGSSTTGCSAAGPRWPGPRRRLPRSAARRSRRSAARPRRLVGGVERRHRPTPVRVFWTASGRTPAAPAPVTTTTAIPAPDAAWATAPRTGTWQRERGGTWRNVSVSGRGERRGALPADLAVRMDGLDWSVRRPVASSSARAALGRPGRVAVARTAPEKAARPEPPALGDGPAREVRLEGVLDGCVVGCCGHPSLSSPEGPEGCAPAPNFSGRRPRAGPAASAGRGAGGPSPTPPTGPYLRRPVPRSGRRGCAAAARRAGRRAGRRTPPGPSGAHADQRVVLDVAAEPSASSPASSATWGRRPRRRQSSTSRRWAMVNTQPRRPPSSPRKPARPVKTPMKVSLARSSGSAAPCSRR